MIKKKILVPRNTAALFKFCFSAHNELATYLFFFYTRHLSDSSHRETYESAHSVILSIFAFHAQRQQHAGKTKTTNVLSGVLRGGDNKHDPEDGRVRGSDIGMNTPISDPLREEAEVVSIDLADFVKRMVPFYAQCLIEVGDFFLFSHLMLVALVSVAA